MIDESGDELQMIVSGRCRHLRRPKAISGGRLGDNDRLRLPLGRPGGLEAGTHMPRAVDRTIADIRPRARLHRGPVLAK